MEKCVTCCTTVMGEMADEAILIEKTLEGDMRAMNELFGRYESRARAIARHFLMYDYSRIEDVLQEATMRAYLNLRNLRDRMKFGHWYLKIVRNISLDAAKRENLYVEKPSDENSDLDFESWVSQKGQDQSELPENISNLDLVERVKEELEHMDEVYGSPIRMRYLEELSYNEIAEKLDKPLGTVKSLIHRGRSILKERLDPDAGACK